MVILLEAYRQPYDAIMAMPSSRRHRIVKIREEIVRNPKGNDPKQAPGAYHTGLSPKMDANNQTDPTSGAWGV